LNLRRFIKVSSTIEFPTYDASYEAAVKAALLKDLDVTSFTSFAITTSRRRLLAGATVGTRRNSSGAWHVMHDI